MKVYNFSAGPAMLPEEVMHKAQEEFCNYGGTQSGILVGGTTSDADSLHTHANLRFHNLFVNKSSYPQGDGVRYIPVQPIKDYAFDDDETNNYDYLSNPQISTSKNDVCGISGTQISFHSPIELHPKHPECCQMVS